MKKEFIFVSLILIITIIFYIITQRFVDGTVNDMNIRLEHIIELAHSDLDNNTDENMKTIKSSIEELNNIWGEKTKILALYIEHNELEKVDTSLVEVTEYLNIDDYEDALPELKKCEFLLNHIIQKNKFDLTNLF